MNAMRIVGSGFLSVEGLAQAEQLRVGLTAIHDLAATSVRLCQESLASVSIESQETPKEKQHVIACVIMARLLEISESILVLARGGFSVEVVAGFRNFLEAFFIFGNVCKDSNFVPKYFNTDLAMRQKLINQASKHKDAPFVLTNEYATPEVRDRLKQEIASTGATDFNTYECACNVGAGHIYDSMYRLASAASHTTPRALTGYVGEAPNGDILEIRCHPQMGSIPNRLHDIAALLLNVRAAFDELFGRPIEPELERVRNELTAIVLQETSES